MRPRILLLATCALLAAPVAAGLLAAGLLITLPGGSGAAHDIPAAYLALYRRHAIRCPGLGWEVLAAIGKAETDHGRARLPGVHTGANPAGAAGPMQFGIGGKAGNTWGGAPTRPVPPHLGFGTDGNGDGIADVYDPADAIAAAADYLCAHGGGNPATVRRAIWAYNHSWSYVDKVLTLASTYATPAPGGVTGAGAGASASGKALGAVRFALAQAQARVPYRWGGDGLEEGGFDCSGLTRAAYASVGVHLPRTSRQQWRAGPRIPTRLLRPGDLVFYARDPTNPATIHHVGIYIGGGLMVDAPHTGATVRVEPFQRSSYIGAVRPVRQVP